MASGLATRCPACGTVFRVVPDQLRVSEGWVRCGRCADVFNAADALVDLDTGGPRAEPAAGAAAPAADAPLPSAPRSAEHAPGLADFGTPLRRAPVPRHAAPDAAADSDFDDPRFAPPVIDSTESRFAADAAELAVAEAAAFASDRADRPAGADSLPAPHGDGSAGTRADATPSFVRRAERAQRWRQPRVRAALLALALLGGVVLAAQLAHTWRDLLAARFPTARPALAQACQWLGCSVGPARVIDALVVESSGLVRVEKSSVYKLSVALRNRAAIDVALPALELALTDGQGKLLARRVLRPAELGAAQTALAAGRDLALQATLQTAFVPATEAVAGYTIELFYP